MSKLISPAYNGNTWHPDRPPIKVIGPMCENCHRPLILNNGKCLCCGQ